MHGKGNRMSNDSKQFEAFDVLGDEISFVRLINTMGSDVEIVNGARVSFGKRREELDEKDKVLIQYLADDRLHQVGIEAIFNVEHPIKWVDGFSKLNDHKTNFFEGTVTNYSKGSLDMDDF